MVFTESADLASCIQVHITQLYAISINAILAITLDPVHICIACTVSSYSSNQAKKIFPFHSVLSRHCRWKQDKILVNGKRQKVQWTIPIITSMKLIPEESKKHYSIQAITFGGNWSRLAMKDQSIVDS